MVAYTLLGSCSRLQSVHRANSSRGWRELQKSSGRLFHVLHYPLSVYKWNVHKQRFIVCISIILYWDWLTTCTPGWINALQATIIIMFWNTWDPAICIVIMRSYKYKTAQPNSQVYVLIMVVWVPNNLLTSPSSLVCCDSALPNSFKTSRSSSILIVSMSSVQRRLAMLAMSCISCTVTKCRAQAIVLFLSQSRAEQPQTSV